MDVSVARRRRILRSGGWLTPPAKISRMRVVTTLKWGQPAPDFELPSTEGRPISLREHRGRDVVLGFYCYDWGGI